MLVLLAQEKPFKGFDSLLRPIPEMSSSLRSVLYVTSLHIILRSVDGLIDGENGSYDHEHV